MAKILLIETATEVCGAAIAVDGKVLSLHETPDSSDHSARLTLQIEACTRDSGLSLSKLDAVAISRGPGSYTSLRVGASVAKGICYALGKPLLAIDTLQALAWASRENLFDFFEGGILPKTHLFAPMIDARRQEVRIAIYDADLKPLVAHFSQIVEDKMFEKWPLLAAEAFGSASPEVGGEKFILSGSGLKKAMSVLNLPESGWHSVSQCSAAHLAALAENAFQVLDFQSVAYFEPDYMKPPNITVPRNEQGAVG